jgi:hypothetical protein
MQPYKPVIPILSRVKIFKSINPVIPRVSRVENI